MENVKYIVIRLLIMPILKTVKATLSGGSSVRITLFKSWCKMNGIVHNTELQAMEHGVIIIFPPKIDKNLDVERILADIRGTLNFLKK